LKTSVSRSLMIFQNQQILLRERLRRLNKSWRGLKSLLDVLADRKSKGGLTGIVLVNGRPQPKYFKCMSGYVVQDDVIMGTLSVRENLYFSAALRLPNSMKWAEKKRRVEKVIGELGLTGCADTK
uniref:ABC transporter domain-containing protein n=1 Tax=Amphimedon queenslandica TaxID=400682 RepID=A0A1X7SX42_AMPQE